MAKYLDEIGLTNLWEKVKQKFTYFAGEGISIDGNVITGDVCEKEFEEGVVTTISARDFTTGVWAMSLWHDGTNYRSTAGPDHNKIYNEGTKTWEETQWSDAVPDSDWIFGGEIVNIDGESFFYNGTQLLRFDKPNNKWVSVPLSVIYEDRHVEECPYEMCPLQLSPFNTFTIDGTTLVASENEIYSVSWRDGRLWVEMVCEIGGTAYLLKYDYVYKIKIDGEYKWCIEDGENIMVFDETSRTFSSRRVDETERVGEFDWITDNGVFRYSDLKVHEVEIVGNSLHFTECELVDEGLDQFYGVMENLTIVNGHYLAGDLENDCVAEVTFSHTPKKTVGIFSTKSNQQLQPLLTAGNGITIEDNVISATGGGGGGFIGCGEMLVIDDSNKDDYITQSWDWQYNLIVPQGTGIVCLDFDTSDMALVHIIVGNPQNDMRNGMSIRIVLGGSNWRCSTWEVYNGQQPQQYAIKSAPGNYTGSRYLYPDAVYEFMLINNVWYAVGRLPEGDSNDI